MNKIVTLMMLILGIFILSASAQDQAEARYSKGRMVEIASLLPFSETEGCSQKRYVGNIIMVQKAGGQITSFTIRVSRSLVKINLSPSLYKDRLSEKDAKNIGSLISRGRRVTTDTYVCGTSSKTVLANYIFAGSQPTTLGQVF